MALRQRFLWLLALAGSVLFVEMAGHLVARVSPTELLAYRDELTAFGATRPVAAVGCFATLYLVVASLPLPGAEILSIVAGALFGIAEGTAIVSFASSIGATVAFSISRAWLQSMVQVRFPAGASAVRRGIEEEGAYYLFLARLVPIIPFFAVNLLMGLTTMRTGTFYWVSQAGMLPATIAYVNAGAHLTQIQSISDILSTPMLLSFAAVGLVPLAARHLVRTLRAGRRSS